MLLAAWLLSPKKPDTRLRDAEAHIRSRPPLYSRYNIRGVQDILQGKIGNRGHIATISDSEAIDIVSRIRSEKGLGPIPYDRLPE